MVSWPVTKQRPGAGSLTPVRSSAAIGSERNEGVNCARDVALTAEVLQDSSSPRLVGITAWTSFFGSPLAAIFRRVAAG
jgi:hypothetical protein